MIYRDARTAMNALAGVLLLIVGLLLLGCENKETSAVTDANPTEGQRDWTGSNDPGLASPAYAEAIRELTAANDRGDFEGAIVAAQRALSIAPASRATWQSLSNLYISAGRDQQAMAFFSDRVKRNHERVWAWFFQGYHAFRTNQWVLASRSFERVTALEPEYAEAWFRLGVTRHTLGGFDEAVIALRTAYKLTPDDALYASMLGRELRIVGAYEEADEVISAAIQKHPESARLHMAWGRLRARGGELVDAETSFRRSIKLDPASVEAHAELATLLQRQGRADEGFREEMIATRLRDYSRDRSFLVERVGLLPDHPVVAMLLAELEMSERKIAEARRWLARSAQFGGDPERIAAGEMWLATSLEDLETAKRIAERLGSGPRGSLGRAMLALLEQDPDAAKKHLERALAAAPEEKIFLRRAADLCRELGLVERADELLVRAEQASFASAPKAQVAVSSAS